MPERKSPVKRRAPVAKVPAAWGFPVVAIGASAGGLSAFTALLRRSRPNWHDIRSDQHLEPSHESALTTLLGKATTMPVIEVTAHSGGAEPRST